MRPRWLISLLVFVAAALSTGIMALRANHLPPDRPIVAHAAAGLRDALEPIFADYTRQTGRPVEASYAGSGTLLGQIESTGRGDLLVSADAETVRLGQNRGVLGEAAIVGRQRLVIVSNRPDVVALRDLLRDDVTVAVADEERAAAGRALRRALDEAGLPWPRAKTTAATVTAAATAVQTGTVDAGVVWRHAADAHDLTVTADLSVSEPVVAATVRGGEGDDLLRFLRAVGVGLDPGGHP